MNKPDQELTEVKRLEKVLMFQRWLYVPAVLLTAFLYDWLYPPAVAAVILLLVTASIVAKYCHQRALSHQKQLLVGLLLLAADIVAAFLMIILAIRQGHTAAYVIFAPMIVETAIRFGLKGSLVADVLFALVFLAVRWYARTVWGVSYPLADYVLMIGVMSFVSLMVGMVSRERRRHRQRAEQLAAERASLLERRRISNELHDSVLKSLEGLALETQALRQRQDTQTSSFSSEQAQYVENVCRQISREIRDVIVEIRSEDTPQNIVERLKKLVDEWQQAGEAELVFICHDSITELPWTLTHNIQKVIEEALTNIRRHTQASRVQITMDVRSRVLSIAIQDNGGGFKADLQDIYAFARRGRLGLITMKERIEMTGGKFEIISNPDGTVITADIPLPSDEGFKRP